MYVLGKLLGVGIGFLAGGPVFAAVGAIVGHFFDRALARLVADDEAGLFNPDSPQGYEHSSQGSDTAQFPKVLFTLAGVLAKADGRVCEAEIEQTQALFEHLGLNAEQKQQAISWFKAGSQMEAQDWQEELQSFNQQHARQYEIKEVLLSFLVAIALADQHLDMQEQVLLNQIAKQLGYSDQAFAHLLASLRAQQQFDEHAQEQTKAGSLSKLDLAYQALGAERDASEAEIKKAYRRLMSQYHPDKLMAQGVPEAMLAMATEKTQEVQAAYELIKKHLAKNS